MRTHELHKKLIVLNTFYASEGRVFDLEDEIKRCRINLYELEIGKDYKISNGVKHSAHDYEIIQILALTHEGEKTLIEKHEWLRNVIDAQWEQFIKDEYAELIGD